MKRYGNLYSKLVDIDNIRLAYHNARKGKAWQAQVKRVDKNVDELLEKLRMSLINHTFTTSKYRTKEIYEPKHRTIYVLPFYPEGKKYVTFTGSVVLIKQCKENKDQMPFVTVIKQVGKYYSFT